MADAREIAIVFCELPHRLDPPENLGRDLLGAQEKSASEAAPIQHRRQCDQHGADESKVQQIDQNDRKKHAAVFEIRLAAHNHRHRECHVEGPGGADHSLEQTGVRWEIQDDPSRCVGADPEQGVERNKIRPQHNECICFVGNNVAAVARNMEVMNAPAVEPHEKSMREFMADHIQPHERLDREESRHAEHRASTEPQQFLAPPKMAVARAIEQGPEKRQRQHPARNEEKRAGDELHPFLRHMARGHTCDRGVERAGVFRT